MQLSCHISCAACQAQGRVGEAATQRELDVAAQVAAFELQYDRPS